MLRISYIILFSLCLFIPGKAQDIHQMKKFSDEQFNRGNYQLALKEYQRVIYFDKHGEYDELYAKIASIHFLNSDYDNALKYYDFALRLEQNDSIKYELVLKKALTNLKQKRYMAALNELFDLPDHPSEFLQDKKDLYLGICYFGLNDMDDSQEHFSELFDSTGIKKVDRLFSDFKDYKKKYRPRKVELMSMLLPGLGQIYTGEVFSGLNSFFLITGVTVYAVYTAVNYALVDGLLVLSSWFYRYYTGGYTNASSFAIKKIENERTNVYHEILTCIENQENQ
ncbi:MAG: hypothetical protein R6U04_04485 [Bacteroidales bacterium]